MTRNTSSLSIASLETYTKQFDEHDNVEIHLTLCYSSYSEFTQVDVLQRKPHIRQCLNVISDLRVCAQQQLGESDLQAVSSTTLYIGFWQVANRDMYRLPSFHDRRTEIRHVPPIMITIDVSSIFLG